MTEGAEHRSFDFREALQGIGLDDTDIEAYARCTLLTMLLRSMRDSSDETATCVRSVLQGTAASIGTTVENVQHFFVENILIMLGAKSSSSAAGTELSQQAALGYVKQRIESALLEEARVTAFDENAPLSSLFVGNFQRFEGFVFRLEWMFGREICDKKVLEKLFTKPVGFLIHSLTEFAQQLQSQGERVLLR